MPGNSLTGTFASSIGSGCVLTTMYTSPEVLGEANWETWTAINRVFPLRRGEYLNLYDISYEKPEAHAVRLATGVQAFAFYDEAPETTTVVSLRGLDEGVTYDVYEMDTLEPVGSVTGPGGNLAVQFSRQGPGMPAWCLLVAVPPMVPVEGLEGDSAVVAPPAFRLGLHPNPVRTWARFEVRAAGERGVGSHALSMAMPVTIDIFDVLGRHVRSLVAESAGGWIRASWDVRDGAGRPVANGRYEARIRGGGSGALSFLVLR
jgi:hypothetical protein